jgi:hypothetical protein
MTGPDEVCRMAQNLARNCGWRLFPCHDDKRPACPHGFKNAANDPDTIAGLWRNYPAPLIGVATGAASGISVLDIDKKHPEAVVWWQRNLYRLPHTRAFATRSGGGHLYLLHRDGVKNTSSKLCKGIDTRGEGGYIIFWFAAGFECLDHTPPQPWPDWLHAELTCQPPPPSSARRTDPERSLDAIVRTLAAAQDGERNSLLYWAACRFAERGASQGEAERALLPAVPPPNNPIKDKGTVASAYRGRAA